MARSDDPPPAGRACRRGGGFSLVGLVLALFVVALASVTLYTYLGATKQSLDGVGGGQPQGFTRLTADLSTLAAMRTQLDVFRSTHDRWPPDRQALEALLRSPPRFQCPGNDYRYDPGTGALGLVISDPGHC